MSSVRHKERAKRVRRQRVFILGISFLLIIGIVGLVLEKNDREDDIESDDTVATTVSRTEFYATESVDCGDWNAQIIFAYVTEDLIGETQVDCVASVCNISGSEQVFDASSVFKMENGGILDEASSDYDYQTISDGASFLTKLYFIFPANANKNVNAMCIHADGKKIYLSPVPQDKEEYDGFAGTYESSGGIKHIFWPVGDNQYGFCKYNPLSGYDITTITPGSDYTYVHGAMQYVLIPEEHTIYTALEGEPDRESYFFVKTNPYTGVSNEADVSVNNEEDMAGTVDDEMKEMMNDPELWFIYYKNFIQEGSGIALEVIVQNDALMEVSYDGVMMDWGFSLQADKTGKDNEMIYYSGADLALSYYPDDHHIHIEAQDEKYCGDYWPQG